MSPVTLKSLQVLLILAFLSVFIPTVSVGINNMSNTTFLQSEGLVKREFIPKEEIPPRTLPEERFQNEASEMIENLPPVLQPSPLPVKENSLPNKAPSLAPPQEVAPIKPPTIPNTTNPKRKLIFTINTGHTGSTSLAHYLDHVSGITAFHEHLFLGEIYFVVKNGYNATYDERRKRALDYLLPLLNSEPFLSNPTEIYVETTQLFSRNMFDVLLDYFHVEHGDQYEVAVINLRRQYACIVRSLLDEAPHISAWSTPQSYMASDVGSDSAYNLFHPHIPRLQAIPEAQNDMTDAVIGFIFDHEAAAVDIHEKYPAVEMIDVRAEELHHMEFFQDLLRDIGITNMEEAFSEISIQDFEGRFLAQNVNPHVPHPGSDPILDDILIHIDHFIQTYKDNNVTLPPLPALERTLRGVPADQIDSLVMCS